MRTEFFDQPNAPTPELETFAASPEGLLAMGDAQVLRRFVQLSGSRSHGGEDLAKQLLLDAAHHTLATAPNGRAVRLELWAWPVTVSFQVAKRVPTASTHGVKMSDVNLRMRMRELWANAFSQSSGLMVAPQTCFMHMNALLGTSPLQIKNAVQQGARLLHGGNVSQASLWGVAPDSFEVSDPDLPATMLMVCYVAVDPLSPSPSVDMPSHVRAGMEQLIRALFSSPSDEPHRTRIGVPQPLASALTQAQALQLAAMHDRAVAMNRQLAVAAEHDTQAQLLPRYEVMVDYYSAGDEDPERSLQWKYTALWRPARHTQDMMKLFESYISARPSFEAGAGAKPYMGFGQAPVWH